MQMVSLIGESGDGLRPAGVPVSKTVPPPSIHCLRSRLCPRNLRREGQCRTFAFTRERICRSALPLERQVSDPLLPYTSFELNGRIGRGEDRLATGPSGRYLNSYPFLLPLSVESGSSI